MHSCQLISCHGNIPPSRFGHTLTYFDEGKVFLFGGATGSPTQFSVTDHAYILDLKANQWKKIQGTGAMPSGRAAHGAVCIEKNKIVIFGGATRSNGLASDDLYHLDLKDDFGVWNIINVGIKTPGKRYGHSFNYSKPYLIAFGGHNFESILNDTWILNIQKSPLSWAQIKQSRTIPPPRMYHTAALSTTGKTSGMLVLFGGRSQSGEALNDTWGFRRRTNGEWGWVQGPQKNPTRRYQHTALFVGSFMFIIGGKGRQNEKIPVQAFNTETNEWLSLESVELVRHASFAYNKNIYCFGGFDAKNSSTTHLYKINVEEVLKNDLVDKFENQISLNSSRSSISSNNSTIEKKSIRTESTQLNPSRYQHSLTKTQLVEKVKRKKILVNPPIIGGINNKKVANLEQKILSEKDVPHYFLNELLQPENYQNSQNIRLNLKPKLIHILCDLAQQIISQQPMVLQVKAPVKIFGDIHGQFTDLMKIFLIYGTPHENGRPKDVDNFDYVFLGDYVDRGSYSIETICLLLSLKVVYPKKIHLLRGNHEDISVNDNFGFMDECMEKFDEDPQDESSVFQRINRLFEWFPLAAVAQNKILCVHGGIGQSLTSVHDIQRIKRPLTICHEAINAQSKVVLDVLWSDPTQHDSINGIHPNYYRDPQGLGGIVNFGPDRVQKFLNKTGLQMIIRAHECVMDGFERFAGGLLITLFSATDYCRQHKNAGAILVLKTNLQIIPKLIYPEKNKGDTWIDKKEYLKRRPPTPPRWKGQQ